MMQITERFHCESCDKSFQKDLMEVVDGKDAEEGYDRTVAVGYVEMDTCCEKCYLHSDLPGF